MTQAIFETHDRFPKQVFVGDKKILEFHRQNINLVKDSNGNLTRLNESDSWICLLTDPKAIKEAKEDKRFGKAYWEIERIPTKHNKTTNVRSGAMTSSNSSLDTTDIKNKAMRLGELKAQIILKDGSFSSKADQSLIDEYEKLKQELN